MSEEAKLVEASVRDGLVKGGAPAVKAVDNVVVARVLSGSIVRVKLWSPGGTVLYSDELGERRALRVERGGDRLFRNGRARRRSPT